MEPVLDLEDVRRCTELLEAIAADRALLAEVPLEMRQALLIAAGQVSRPQSYQEKRLVKALRRGKRRRDEARGSRDARGHRDPRGPGRSGLHGPVPAPPGRRPSQAPRAS